MHSRCEPSCSAASRTWQCLSARSARSTKPCVTARPRRSLANDWDWCGRRATGSVCRLSSRRCGNRWVTPRSRLRGRRVSAVKSKRQFGARWILQDGTSHGLRVRV